MKYKCKSTYIHDHEKLINEGDTVIVHGNNIYNVTTRMDYHVLPEHLEYVMKGLEPLNESSEVELKPLTDIDKFTLIVEQMIETFKKKNHDYGNSFNDSLDEEGIAAARVRIGDKWKRFQNLSKGNDIQVKDESLRDTLMDLSNYCIMTVMWLDKQKNLQNE